MKKNVFLKERKVFEESNHLYLKLVYEYEDDRGIHELIVPKIDLEIRTDLLPIINNEEWTSPIVLDYYKIKLGSNIFDLIRDDVEVKKNGDTFTCEKAAYVVNTLKKNIKK